MTAPLNILFVGIGDELLQQLEDELSSTERALFTRAAETKEAARTLMESERPDLVIARHTLPDGDALELLPDGDLPPFPLLVIADNSEDELVALGRTRAGAVNFIHTTPAGTMLTPQHVECTLREWRLVCDQIRAEKDLRDKEEFNFALFQHNPAPTIIVDTGGHVLKSNLARRKQPRELPALDAPLFDPNGEDDEPLLHNALNTCISEGKVMEIPEARIGDAYFAVTMAATPQGAIVISDDITDKKRAEEETQRQQEQLIQADKMVALGTLVSGVAHEVSNPNNVLLLCAASLQRLWQDVESFLEEEAPSPHPAIGGRPAEELAKEFGDLIAVVIRSAERIRDLVSELKDFARKDSSELRTDVNINEPVRSATSLMRSLIKKSAPDFSEEYAEDLPRVTANAQRIEQVVVNLIANACQALGSSGGGLTVRTRRGEPEDHVIVEVQDEGCGIPRDALERITDPFFTTRHDEGGTGLGLAISQKIVQSYDGRLEFESEPGKGTLARIVFPCSSCCNDAGKESA
jgi:signal transduction histidine kinase/DNA-binding NarL/FixJ family response regulator